MRLGEHPLACVICLKEFVAKRSHALTCTPACRTALSRLRKQVLAGVTLTRKGGESVRVAHLRGATQEAHVIEVLERIARMEARLAEALLDIQRTVYAIYMRSGIPVERAPNIFELLVDDDEDDSA
jgi:hypothetical protein